MSSESPARRLHAAIPVRDGLSTPSADGLARLNAAQQRFYDLEMGLFIHFGLATFNDRGCHNDGFLPAACFNPGALDCHDWMRVASAMGARYVCMTARHEDGFCLWPTATTDYGVAGSPWRGGRGDVVREFVNACRAHELLPCLYHSSYHDGHHTFQPGDDTTWHKPWFATQRERLAAPGMADTFTAMQCRQVEELLSNYGPIGYLWMDHFGETQGILDPAAVEAFWLAIVDTARRCQPDCLLLGPDVWLTRGENTGGVHGGAAAYPLWTAHRREIEPSGQSWMVADPHGPLAGVWESNTIFSGGWFWNGPGAKAVAQMIEHYYLTVGRGATFLPNFAPDPRGLMTDEVHACAAAFGDAIRGIESGIVGEAAGTGTTLELALPAPGEVNHVVLMEDLAAGQRVCRFRVEGLADGRWTALAQGETIGHKVILRVPPARIAAARLHCESLTAAAPQIRRFAVGLTR